MPFLAVLMNRHCLACDTSGTGLRKHVLLDPLGEERV